MTVKFEDVCWKAELEKEKWMHSGLSSKDVSNLGEDYFVEAQVGLSWAASIGIKVVLQSDKWVSCLVIRPTFL